MQSGGKMRGKTTRMGLEPTIFATGKQRLTIRPPRHSLGALNVQYEPLLVYSPIEPRDLCVAVDNQSTSVVPRHVTRDEMLVPVPGHSMGRLFISSHPPPARLCTLTSLESVTLIDPRRRAATDDARGVHF